LRDRWRGCDHFGVLLSLLYRLVRSLLGLIGVLVGSELSKDVELLVLRHENQVLRRQLRGRPQWEHADRLWLAALARLVHRQQWAGIFPVTPETLLRWHRNLVARKWNYSDRRRPGRPRTGVVLAEKCVRAGERRSAWQVVAPGMDGSGCAHDTAVPRDDGWLCCCDWPT
jgi:putative transposase